MMMLVSLFIALILGSPPGAWGHGHLTLPHSTRQGGSLQKGGKCEQGECFWFSNIVEIPGHPSLPYQARSVKTNATVSGTPRDFFRTSPWLAPGTTRVFGSGCGSAGGGPIVYNNGGEAPEGFSQGMDAILLPQHHQPARWEAGSVVEVAWAITANHGGGYSYRLCPADSSVTEECFQANQLQFAPEGIQWLIYTNGSKSERFPMTKVTHGTFPHGSEWARNPIPACYICDTYEECGLPIEPVPGLVDSAWHEQLNCVAGCNGSGSWNVSGGCPTGTPHFPEPLPGISGFEKRFFYDFSIMDKVVIPPNLQPGPYLLSWRWDCEESSQVWENCADVIITSPPKEEETMSL